jgi:hypothetical protein
LVYPWGRLAEGSHGYAGARTVRRWAGSGSGEQYKELLERQLPENLKLLIAKQIENNIFAKVRAVLQPAGAGK